MSTSSTIAVKQVNGSIKQIYVHFDGYLDGVGQTLLSNYNSEGKANEIINLGSLSCLEKTLEPTEESHTIKHPQKDVTIAYHRDNGEKLVINTFVSMDDYNRRKEFQQYNYLFMEGSWHVYEGSAGWVELTEELIETGITIY